MRNKSLLVCVLILAMAGLACNLGLRPEPTATPTVRIYADTFFSGRAFVDANHNAILDPLDPPLAGARFSAAGFGALTGASGHATIVIPGGWDQPVQAEMAAPEGSAYTLIGPKQVTLQASGPTSADFLFAPPAEDTPSPAASATTGKVIKDQIYCTTAGGVRLDMDVFYPASSAALAPAILYIHGGGWTGGDKGDDAGLLFAPLLSSKGYVVFNINYRLAPQYKFPAQIEDVRCAVRYLRANAGLYNINPQRIGAAGGSAGGHLAALLGLVDEQPPWPAGAYQESYANQSSRVQAVLDMFGPTDLDQLIDTGATFFGDRVFDIHNEDDTLLRVYSPVTYVSADDPPFLIMHGKDDQLIPVSQSQLLYEQLLATGIEARLVLVANAGHSFRPVNGEPDPSLLELAQIGNEFFDQYLKK